MEYIKSLITVIESRIEHVELLMDKHVANPEVVWLNEELYVLEDVLLVLEKHTREGGP